MRKAMILAAGRGERLRPLTEALPKALVEAGGKPLLAWHLERLAAAGCREAVVNVSHLAERIVERIGDGAAFGLSVTYSPEAEPLETAGGIAHALPLLGPEPFLLVNSDVYCEVGFEPLLRRDLGGALGHLVVVPNPGHRPDGDFALVGDRVSNEAGPRYTYAGVAVLSPRLVAGVAPGEKAALGPLLRRAAGEGRLTGELFEGLWQDVGTAERLAGLRSRIGSRT